VATPYNRGEVDYWEDPIPQTSAASLAPAPEEEEEDEDKLGFELFPHTGKTRAPSLVTPPLQPRPPTPDLPLLNVCWEAREILWQKGRVEGLSLSRSN
jgi:hypothetical protein